MFEAIVGAHLLDERHLLEIRLLVDYKDHILVWKRLVVKTGSDIVCENVNASIGSLLVPWVEQVQLYEESTLEQKSDIHWNLNLSFDDLS